MNDLVGLSARLVVLVPAVTSVLALATTRRQRLSTALATFGAFLTLLAAAGQLAAVQRQGRHGRHRLSGAQPLDRRELADRGEQREERPERGDRRGQPLPARGRERQHGGDGGHQDDEPGA